MNKFNFLKVQKKKKKKVSSGSGSIIKVCQRPFLKKINMTLFAIMTHTHHTHSQGAIASYTTAGNNQK